MALQKLRSDATGVTYADPSDPDFTVRFKFQSAGKSLNGNPVQNHTTEVIVNDLVDVTIGSETVKEALSIRFRVSGSFAAKTRKDALIAAIATKFATWSTENVWEGFEPTTPPDAPV